MRHRFVLLASRSDALTFGSRLVAERWALLAAGLIAVLAGGGDAERLLVDAPLILLAVGIGSSTTDVLELRDTPVPSTVFRLILLSVACTGALVIGVVSATGLLVVVATIPMLLVHRLAEIRLRIAGERLRVTVLNWCATAVFVLTFGGLLIARSSDALGIALVVRSLPALALFSQRPQTRSHRAILLSCAPLIGFAAIMTVIGLADSLAAAALLSPAEFEGYFVANRLLSLLALPAAFIGYRIAPVMTDEHETLRVIRSELGRLRPPLVLAAVCMVGFIIVFLETVQWPVALFVGIGWMLNGAAGPVARVATTFGRTAAATRALLLAATLQLLSTILAGEISDLPTALAFGFMVAQIVWNGILYRGMVSRYSPLSTAPPVDVEIVDQGRAGIDDENGVWV